MKVTNYKWSRFARELLLVTLLMGIWVLAIMEFVGMVIFSCMLWYIAYTKHDELMDLEREINQMEKEMIIKEEIIKEDMIKLKKSKKSK